ncbi:MAG: CvpA family protein [Anaerolineae bacterium]|jgi:uncharacterized membrane protein required for colicin V production
MADLGINPFDVIIIGVLLGGVFIGMVRGLVRMVLNLLMFYVGAVLAVTFHTPLANLIRQIFAFPRRVCISLAFVLILVATYALLTFIIRRTYKDTELPGIRQLDQLGGLIVGFLVTALWIGFGILVMSFFLSAADVDVQGIQRNLITYFRRSAMVDLFYDFLPVALATLRPWMPKGIPPEILTTRL